ncbi:MAG: hypothetical protein NC453_12165 [Muribaculum sp.]|nr:hypothetical protein [Muribaculum sp.]
MPKRRRHRGEVKRITREEFERLVANPSGQGFWGRSPEQILFHPGDIVEILSDNVAQIGIVLEIPMTMDAVWEEVVQYQSSFGGKPIMPGTFLHDISEDVYKVIGIDGEIVDIAPICLRPPIKTPSCKQRELLEQMYRRLAPDRIATISSIWNEIHEGEAPVAFYWRDDSETEYFYDPTTDSIASENGFGIKIERQTSEITKPYIARLIIELENEIAVYFRKNYPYKLW